MSEDQNNNIEVQAGDATDTPKAPKSNLIKYILFGAGGMVIALVVAILVVFMMGTDKQTADNAMDSKKQATENKQSSSENHESSNSSDAEDISGAEMEELGLTEEDQSAMDKIMDNLAFLDYQPDESEMVDEDTQKKIQDSIKEVNWIEEQKTILAERERELNNRQKEIDKIEKQVNQKILRIEQAESARIAKLAKLYDGMDARAVAKLMSNLDDETVVSIIPRMNSKNASAVMQLFPSQRAARLSKRMITIAGN